MLTFKDSTLSFVFFISLHCIPSFFHCCCLFVFELWEESLTIDLVVIHFYILHHFVFVRSVLLIFLGFTLKVTLGYANCYSAFWCISFRRVCCVSKMSMFSLQNDCPSSNLERLLTECLLSKVVAIGNSWRSNFSCKDKVPEDCKLLHHILKFRLSLLRWTMLYSLGFNTDSIARCEYSR